MTKKEIIAVQALLLSARSAAIEIESYCRDFDSTTLRGVAEDLKKAVSEFRKTAKI